MTKTSVPDRSGTRPAVVGTTLAILFSYMVLLAIDPETVNRLGWEDGPIETAGAVFFLAAAAGFFVASIRTVRQSRERGKAEVWPAVVFTLLALVMFVCFGEEISWGQRVFGWQTPSLIAALNAQNETNLHNIQAVHQWNPDGTEKGFIGKLVNMNRLFSVFWLTAFVLLPVVAAGSDRIRRRFKDAEIPVPPLWVGGMFLSSYVVYKVLALIYQGTLRAHALDELKETSYAAIYAFLAVVVLIREAKRE